MGERTLNGSCHFCGRNDVTEENGKLLSHADNSGEGLCAGEGKSTRETWLVKNEMEQVECTQCGTPTFILEDRTVEPHVTDVVTEERCYMSGRNWDCETGDVGPAISQEIDG